MTPQSGNRLRRLLIISLALVWAIGLTLMVAWLFQPPRDIFYTVTNRNVIPPMVLSITPGGPVERPRSITEHVTAFFLPWPWNSCPMAAVGFEDGPLQQMLGSFDRPNYLRLIERLATILALLLVATWAGRIVLRRLPRPSGFDVIPVSK